MNASDLYKAGKLSEAVDAQLKEVKASPADHAKRLFLFELLVFSGDLERAKKQIENVNYGQMEIDAAVLAYRKLIDSEQARRQLFQDGVAPRFFGEQPEHVHMRLEAVNCFRENRPDGAGQFLAQANGAAPAVKGQLNDKPFDSLRDCDDLFGTVLEVMAQGSYYWVPLEQVESITMNPPRFPRDLIWIPARLELLEGAAGNVYLPVLYPGSEEQADNQVKLGRTTDWKDVGAGLVRGVGAHLYLAGEADMSLPEWRELKIG